jgi:hypothetical protein
MAATQTGFAWTGLLFGLSHIKNSFSGIIKTYPNYNENPAIAQVPKLFHR